MKRKQKRFYSDFARLVGRIRRLGFERISLVSELRSAVGHNSLGTMNRIIYSPTAEAYRGSIYSSQPRYALQDAQEISRSINF